MFFQKTIYKVKIILSENFKVTKSFRSRQKIEKVQICQNAPRPLSYINIFKSSLSTIARLSKYNPVSYHILLTKMSFTASCHFGRQKHILYVRFIQSFLKHNYFTLIIQKKFSQDYAKVISFTHSRIVDLEIVIFSCIKYHLYEHFTALSTN